MLLRIVILVFALGAAGGAAWLTMSASNRAAPQQQVEVEVPTKDVLVAVQNVAGGEVLSPDKMRWQPMPENTLQEQFILRETSPDAMARFSGSFVNR
ncbi:MAG: Flp pilus assembly protein CpaB, partial [Pseudomonadota bacterium]